MTIGELRLNEILTANVPRLAKALEKIAAELERANKLKEYELRSRLDRRQRDYTASHNELDKIMREDCR